MKYYRNLLVYCLVPTGFLSLILGSPISSPLQKAWGQVGKRDNPLPRKEQILERFVAEFVLIKPGQEKFPASFEMGSRSGLPDAQPVHKVTFDYTFAIAKYEMTQELYQVIMGANPSRWKGPRNSVEKVDWNEANSFCQKATKELRDRKLLKADEEIRLPSEAEWEYACRAGSTTKYCFGNDEKKLTDYAWYRENSKGHDPPVGKKMPNAWGIYDMHGYVYEWCLDDWHSGYEKAPANGSAWRIPEAKEKVIRGGSWAHDAEECRSAFRQHVAASARDDKIGFRCILARVKSENSKQSSEGAGK